MEERRPRAFAGASEARSGIRVLHQEAIEVAQPLAGHSSHAKNGVKNVITEVLSAAPATIGFRSRATLDESAEQREKTCLAVARAKEGDQDAIRFLYVSYSHNVYGYVRSIVRDDHEAEDVTQHVFAKLMTALAKYDDRGIPFSAWLLRLARNLAIDHIRANRLTPMETILDAGATSSGGDFDRAEAVRAALATLPHEQREVVILRHVLGFSPGEIAHRMGRSESSVHGLHHRGRRALRRELEGLDSAPFTRNGHSIAA
jgi:RNA polymerase sigma-70 factor (ECF subfamily)